MNKKYIALSVLISMLYLFCFAETTHAHTTEDCWWGYRIHMSKAEAENFVRELEDYTSGAPVAMPLLAFVPNMGVRVVLGMFSALVIKKCNSICREIRRCNSSKGITMEIHCVYKGPLGPGGWTVKAR